MKSVLDIDVNDEKWKRFLESFKEYKGSTEKLNEVWKHFDVAINKPRGSTEALSKAIGKASKSSSELQKTWARVGASIEGSEKSLSRFSRTVGTVHRGLSGLMRLGLGVGKFALAAGGIGGIGGLFGLDVLANAALQRQKVARGLGMPIGKVSAFNTYMQPYLANPQSTLSAIVNARQNPASLWAFSGLGIPLGQAERESPTQLAEQVMMRVRSLYLANKNSPAVGAILQARGAGVLGFDLESARRLANTPTAELMKSFSRQQAAAKALNFSDQTATAWANLKIQLHAAGLAIETDLIRKLVMLAPLFSMLSSKVVSLINRFVNSREVGKLLNELGSGLKSAVSFLESKKFENDLTQLGNAAMVAAHFLLDLAHPIKTAKRAIFGPVIAPHLTARGRERYYTDPSDWRKFNNPGNVSTVLPSGLRVYEKFGSMGAGYRAVERAILDHHHHTVAGITTSFEGRNAPHLQEHIAAIARDMGVRPNARLNVTNSGTMAQLVAELVKFEGHAGNRQNFKALTAAITTAIEQGMSRMHLTVTSAPGARVHVEAYAGAH